ncbi:hypothetical protein BdWA1_000348 [Babesia duncani]|uniref:Uncharacterized protein n=1 Tax=Babesia duncani TaxID=323732 RepID=A0AAD9UPY0_9APIC|nr:hypothetical protein BdWA1_000348 [Babesia duncani]
MSGSHQGDFYFKYIFSGSSQNFEVFQIDKIKFDNQDFTLESNKTFMSIDPSSIIVYSCQIGSNNFHPWLLQIYGTAKGNSDSSDQSEEDYLNYFFKRDGNNVFKIHEFTESLTAMDTFACIMQGNM